MLGELDELVLAAGQQGEGRHRLALRTGRDHADLARRVAVDVLDVDQRAGRDVQHPEVVPELHVLAHAQPERGDLAPAGDGGVGDLLDAVEVAGEAGRDDPPVAVLVEERAQDPPDAALARGVAGLLGVRRVAQQHADALGLGDLADAGEVGAAVVDRRQVELEVARVQDHALRRVHGDGVGVGDAVGDGDELDVERRRCGCGRRRLDGVERRAPEQAGLLDAVAGQPERQRRAVDRHADLAEQELDAADVVLVTVGGDEAVDALGVVAQVREVGQHEVDAVQVGAGEHQPAVDEQDPAVVAGALLDGHAVATDLPQAAEEDEADGLSHGQPAGSRRPRRRRRRATADRRPSVGGSARRARPRWRSIALAGPGFGAVVAGLVAPSSRGAGR